MSKSSSVKNILFAFYLIVTQAVVVEADELVDKNATLETKALYQWLNRTNLGTLIGSVYIGGREKGWETIEAVSGKVPGLFALEYFDVGPIENKKLKRDEIRDIIIKNYSNNGLNSIHDHVFNFYTKGDYRDRNSESLKSILPGGVAHRQYVKYLDRFVAYINSLTYQGKKIPILYRPFHEQNGDWFWWNGIDTAADLIEVWRFTVDYIKNIKKCNSIIWVWSLNISKKPTIEQFYSFWPGAEYVDLIGLDGYQTSGKDGFSAIDMRQSYNNMYEISLREKKPLAWTEVGFTKNVRAEGFWMQDFYIPLEKHYQSAKFVVLWSDKWGPNKDHVPDYQLREVLKRKTLLTRGQLKDVSIYQ